MKGAQRRRSMRFLGGQGSVKEVSVKEGSMKEGSMYQGSMKESSMKDGSEFDGSFDQVDFEPEPSCRELDPLNTYLEEPLTMYKWIQWKKCKTYKLNDLRETYPSIRPAISKCDPVQTLQNIDDALEANKCGRLFEKPERDDTLTVWNYSPNKETLAWYGIGPEADGYNKALSKSLKAASLQPKKPKKKPKSKQQKKKAKGPSGAFVLNRECLKEKLDKMPNVRRQLNPTNTLSFLHCPPPADPGRPFDDQGGFPEITLKMALDMQKKEKRPKHGLRRPTWYCPVQCGEAESKCTDYEWAKYKLDPRPYDEAFKREMEAEAAAQALKDPEPGNYEELYTSLATCFVQELKANDMCAAIAKCCKDPKDPPLLGCNEFTPDGAGGDGKFGDGHGSGSDEDGEGKGKGKRKKGHGFGDEYDDLEGRDQDELGWGEDESDGDGGGGGQGDGKGRGDRGRGKGHGHGKKKGGAGGGGGRGGKKKKKFLESPSPMEEEEEELPPPPPPPPPPEPESIEEEEVDEGDGDSKKSDDGKKKRKRRRRKKGDGDLYKNRGKIGGDKSDKDGKGKGKGGKGGIKDCPCEICCQVGKQEEDSPLIKEMRKRDEERKVREYLLQMRHRQYLECKDPDYRAPQHKCEAIECDSRFCGNLRMQKHFGRVQAVQQLQRALKRRNRCGDKCLSKELDGLLSRLCNRLTRSGYCG